MNPFEMLYRRGVIGPWYLRDSQLELYRRLKTDKRVVAKCRRRYGKGTTTYLHCVEECLKRRINVRVGLPTQLQAFSVFDFLLSKMFYKCPDLKPKMKNGAYQFENGSKIFLFGVADSLQIDRARGSDSDIIVCDEFGFWTFRPEYTLKSILIPQLLENSGQLIITSTPPFDLTHYYIDIVHQASLNGTLFEWTIDDSLRIGEISEEEHQEIIRDAGGIDSEAYRREWQCHLIPSSSRLVIPEGQDEALYIGEATRETRPEYFDAYVCMDLGLIDKTAILFGYLDFKNARLVVERELITNYSTTATLANEGKKIEKEMGIDPYRRIGDCELQQLFDMTKDYDYSVTPITKRSRQSGKGFKESVLNGLRIGVKEGKILIDPNGCPNLIKQVKYGIWNERRTDFERSETLGHLDGLMALAYLFDNIEWDRNPYPHKYENLRTTTHFIKEEYVNIGQRKKAGFGRLIGRS